MQVKLIRELLRQEIDDRYETGLLIRPEVLVLINDCREELKQLSANELKLLFLSALSAEYEVAYWAGRAYQDGVPVDEIVLKKLESENFRTRATAVAILARFGERFVGPIIRMLTDNYPLVRVAAIKSLEQLQSDGAWRRHLVYECYAPAGRFIMGDDQGLRDEKPAHEVYLEAFYIGRYPVTNAEYKRYKDDIGRDFHAPEGRGNKDNHPVENVSYYDARGYAAWAGMQLPTEAEWEKAASWDARTGEKRKYPWGNEFDKSRCNTVESGIDDTTLVGQYSPEGDSPCGCADMAGNVWEWTNSLYKDYPYQADDGREDTASSGDRTLRGGAYVNQRFARVTCRNRDNPNNRGRHFGFRVCI